MYLPFAEFEVRDLRGRLISNPPKFTLGNLKRISLALQSYRGDVNQVGEFWIVCKVIRVLDGTGKKGKCLGQESLR